MIHSIITRRVALIAVLLLVTACGGGGAAGLLTTLAGVGSGGTGNVIGFVTGFGSLIVDGMRRNDSGAGYLSEARQGTAMAMPMTGVMLGQSAELSHDASGNITSVMISPEIVGTVSAVASSGVTVVNTSIRVNNDPALGPATSFVGYVSLADIQVGDSIEAHGLLKNDSQGRPYLQATLIVQIPVASGVRLTGTVSQYNASVGSFALGGQTIMLGSASISPAGATLANGLLVTVWSNTAPTGNILNASAIRIKRPAPASGNLTLSGAITNYASNSSFHLRTVTVDASAATISPASASLGNDKYVVVSGSYDATTNKLAATSVVLFTAAAPTSVEVHGMVANYVSTASFTLRGVVIDASAATFVGGTASQLANGAFVEVRGTISNNVVRASTVQFIAFTPSQAPSGSIIEVGGMLSAFDPKTGAFTLNLANGSSMSGSMAAGTVFRNGNAASLAVGQTVSIAGMFSNNTLSGAEVNFQAGPPASNGIMQMSGIAANVTATSFTLNGVTIQRNGVAIQGNGMMGGGRGMMGGSRVNVSVQLVGGQYLATAISLLDS